MDLVHGFYAENLQLSKRSLTWPTSCRPPTADHHVSPHLTTVSCLSFPTISPFRSFCTFSHFLSHAYFFKFLWDRGMEEAVHKRSGEKPYAFYLPVLAFSYENRLTQKNRKKHALSTSYGVEDCSASSGELAGPLFRISELRKTPFFRNGPNSEKNAPFSTAPVF